MVFRHRAQVAVKRALFIMIAISGLVMVASVRAAPLSQQTIVLGAETPLAGTLDDQTPGEVYAFPCFAGGIASVYAETTAGDLTVDLTVRDEFGTVFATGSVVQTDPAVSIAEAFEMPSESNCTVSIDRVGTTAGSYILRLLPGYAVLDKWDAFDGTGDPRQMEWLPYLSDTMESDIRDQQLEITVMGKNIFSFIIPEDADIFWTDLYIQADFIIDAAPVYFEYGFLLRSDVDGDTFYSLALSSDSDWSYYYFDRDWVEIQPWTVSPILDGTDQKPRLGVLLQGNIASVFYNHRYVGEIADLDQFASSGIIGVSLSTGVNQNEWLMGHIDNLIITRPWGK